MSGGGGAGGFLARWSRRKAGLATAEPVAPAATPPPATPAAAARTPEVVAPAEAQAASAAAPVPAAPLPTLADVAALTRDSDYSRFMLPGVDGAVRNAAMKKLFSDPHFNVMDGLDIYIDDYGKPDPLPPSMLRRMHQSAALGLFDDDVAAPAAPAAALADGKACPDGGASGAVAPSRPTEPPAAPAPSRAEDDPDLRLQPDDVDRRPDPGAGPRP